MSKQKKYHIWTIGCQMNEADSRHLATQLEGLGYVPHKRAEESDVVVLNTCVVRQGPEDKAANRLNSLKPFRAANKDMVIALMGCMVGKKERARLEVEFPFVDVFLEPSQTEPLIELLCERQGIDFGSYRIQSELLHDYDLPSPAEGAVMAYVPITLGCSHVCSYCVIPYRRGPDRSRDPEEILAECRSLAAQGVREIGLLGQIVDRFGMDLPEGQDLAWLLREVAKIDGIWRVRFLTSHPKYMDDNLIEAVAEEPKLMPHFELPFQAGNNRILKEMRRGYTREEYIALVGKIRARIPDAGINTDIIVGYPGETREEFMDTFSLLEETRLDMAHIAKYSPRPRTLSAKQPDDVTAEEKEIRRKMLDDLMEVIQTEENAPLVGRTVEVLVEEFNPKKNNWRGRTPQNKLVFFADEENRKGQLVEVKVTWAGPYSMTGDFVGLAELP